MAATRNRMDIVAMLNPTGEDLEMPHVEVEVTTISYDSIHPKPMPVEIGGCYVQPYPTPRNSPVQQHSTPSSIFYNAPQLGPLPSVNHLLGYPSPPPSSEACLPSKTYPPAQTSNGFVKPYVHARHVEQYYTATSCPEYDSYSRRSTRRERDSLRRASRTPPPTPVPAYVEARKQLLVLAQVQASPKKGPSHSNEAYRLIHVHWTRYCKVDMKAGWHAIEHNFKIMFPNEREDCTPGGLSSRYYRDNFIPRLDLHGNVIYKDGKPLMMDMKVRGKDMGECKGCPWTFVERHPWWALKYDWVLQEHKIEAAKIIADIEKRRPGQYSRKQQYVLAIREVESKREAARESKRNGTFSEPLLDDEEFESIPSPTEEEIKEIEDDERYVENLYKEASQQEFVY
ncbi:uncharacterized protein LY89DRAFT_780438 [Mollisia scopiformis]|uniref:Uncharacterized protein n=1 Tax=Mollisia scopiformis TaxID=149040 RepID=A0A194XH72_MOLSC|nr:uncharacterized protein LY89DRAFT_780438 [Mollisia scopiformis]KUJ19513.1 hypothetical protein LY89DRAFT_780438 [Mollisia scopiformis]